jgi:FixJ family two-component response regulator
MNVSSLGVISVVDDNEPIRAATKALLRSMGYKVETFASAELFLESDALRETACLILDVQMPGIDGLELQRRLKEARSRIPIIFISAHDERANRHKAMGAGAVNFFRKPFDVKAFLAAIESVVSPSPIAVRRSSSFGETSPNASPRYSQSEDSSNCSPQRPSKRNLRPKSDTANGMNPSPCTMTEPLSNSGLETIVVVDDQAVVLEFCQTTLEMAGYKVFTAANGEQALSLFGPNRSPVDLALIDVVMPGMSGIELAQRLEKLTDVRIVLMSGYSPQDVKQVVGERARDYRSLWKPFEARTLVQMIKNALDTDSPKRVFVDEAQRAGT